ncbi:dTDP-4-amino-4,6-dideoxygalactose transaminase [Jannaschia sp. M317]|uniref:dTDP-4-amino-4,6-dideoxygalactose transaminase n=1 Tax=Jannaschia sp. M317 TaxID=2867011 RepID=UPI0021A532BF|nr:dTDP-4-amino-4,6-dideoxygalactose transaminase [Jannaschia sp. M317]UWQ19673.1 dTDP-4-amino-4,6-dideoxygalactose transaminase [Jannaschia sp. M317]
MQKIPFNAPSIVGDELAYISDAIARGQLSGDGHYTKLCNKLIEAQTGSPKALLTHSCTAALEMAAILCDLAPGDEVIMPSFTFVSTANAVALRGAIPVFVDIDPDTLNISPAAAEAAITDKTRAIFAVHYAGVPAEMDALRELTDAHGLMLIEDAAQALGSTYHGRPCGSLGDAAAFSFHETKNLISGEGGALTINREDLAARAEIIREKGTNRSRFLRGQVDKYTWVDIGSSFLPGELVAAFLYGQLENTAQVNNVRLAAFDSYNAAFADLEQSERLRRPIIPQHAASNGHMFYLMLRDIADRDSFIAHMRDHGIATPFHYVPLHSSPGGETYGRVAGSLEVTDDTSARLVRLPVYYSVGDKIDRVIEIARTYLTA